MRSLVKRIMLTLFCAAVNSALAAQTRKFPARHGEGAQRKGDYPSPDGKYLAHVFIGDGDTTDLQIYHAPSPQVDKGKAGLLAQPVSDSAGYLWVPGKPHTLVFGVSGLYGEAKLALWEGGSKLRLLRQAKSPADETFVLDAISSDGKTVYYRHGKDDQNWSAYTHGEVPMLQPESKRPIHSKTQRSSKPKLTSAGSE